MNGKWPFILSNQLDERHFCRVPDSGPSLQEGDHVRLKIETWDSKVDNVARHKYRVEGKLEVLAPAN
jgi:hypothetical protein